MPKFIFITQPPSETGLGSQVQGINLWLEPLCEDSPNSSQLLCIHDGSKRRVLALIHDTSDISWFDVEGFRPSIISTKTVDLMRAMLTDAGYYIFTKKELHNHDVVLSLRC